MRRPHVPNTTVYLDHFSYDICLMAPEFQNCVILKPFSKYSKGDSTGINIKHMGERNTYACKKNIHNQVVYIDVR